MSIATWKKEFYTKSAKSKMTKLEAVEHSLKKWRGLTKANLKKHNSFKSDFSNIIFDEDGEDFLVNDETCALCVKYYESDDLDRCKKCPLLVSYGNACAYPTTSSPYNIFYDKSNPNKMIKALEKTLENIVSGKIK